MITLMLNLTNPFVEEKFDNLFCRSGMITTHKAWEIELIKYSRTLLKAEAKWSVKTNHAGPSISVGLLGYEIELQIYDTRHWNNETNAWEVYNAQ
jgi:hypothetical protein